MRVAICTTLFSILFIYILSNFTKPLSEQYHLEGPYVLELVISEPGFSTSIIALQVFTHPIFGHMGCDVEKDNIIRRTSEFLKKAHATVTCALYHEEGI